MQSWRSLYPYTSQYFALSPNGSQEAPRIHYVDEGGGRPLLMVHGNPTWSFYYRNLIEAFRGDYRTIAMDHVGCGLSDKPADHGYRLQDRIDDLTALVEELDLKDITLLAHDWGGAIGLGTVLRLPERFAQVVLFNTAAFPPPFIPKRISLCRIPVLGTIGIRGFNLFARAALWMAVEDRRNLPAEVRAGLIAPYDSWANRRAINEFVKDIPGPHHPTWQVLVDIENGLRSLKLPTKLVWGMKDWCFNTSCLKRLQELMPHADAHPIESAGHYVIEEAAEEIIRHLRPFLETA
jgi:pimeloyl-ACP methyl ester carboxylesterase